LKPSECLTNLFHEVRAAIRFFNDGVRNPNFIENALPHNRGGGQRYRMLTEVGILRIISPLSVQRPRNP